MSDKTVEEVEKLVDNAKAPGTFSILNVLKERAYPKDEVVVYLDEQTAFKAAELKTKIDELNQLADLENQDVIDALIEERDAFINELEDSKYTFFIDGISEGLRDDLMNEALEEYPMEYDEEKNPFTGETTRKERENKERDKFFTDLLWFNHIVKIVAPDGSVQDKVTMKDVQELRRSLPIAAITKITGSIDKIRMATALFMMTVDEDFLAKS